MLVTIVSRLLDRFKINGKRHNDIKSVNKETFERECIKVGIASGKDWRHVVKRSRGFRGYDLRIQRTYHSTLFHVWQIEQLLHEKFKHDSYQPKIKFGGHTECFKISSLILRDFPKNSS